MGELKKFGAEATEYTRAAIGGFLLEAIGGQGGGPQQLDFERFEKDQARLSAATNKEHFVAEKEVDGVLLGKAELGGGTWGRVSQEDGRVALVPWREEMTDLLGMDVKVSREAGQTKMQALERGGMERER